MTANHITRGKACDFSFYVRAFDSKSHFSNYREPMTGLSIQEAMKEFERQCAENPDYVNTVLGVDFAAKDEKHTPHNVGAADLLQRVKGRLHLSEDYKRSEILMNEPLISVNAVEMLKKESARLQRASDNATEKCAKQINDNMDALCADTDFRSDFFRNLVNEYGVERCKFIFANELFGHDNDENKNLLPSRQYLKDSYDGEYNKRFGIFATSEQISELTDTLKSVESSLTETESKLHRAGLVNGENSRDISDKSAAVAGEIERHNELEDIGAVNEDGLQL